LANPYSPSETILVSNVLCNKLIIQGL